MFETLWLMHARFKPVRFQRVRFKGLRSLTGFTVRSVFVVLEF